MAQECFCGCGRQIKGFATKGMNKQGRRTVEMVERCRAAAQERLENKESWGDGDVMPVVEMLEEYAKEGDMYAEFWAGAVHDTDLPPPGEARAIKKAWVDWGKRTRPVVGLAELPPDELKAVIQAAND